MIRLITDVVKVVSPSTSPLMSPGSPLKPAAATEAAAAAEPSIDTRKKPLQVIKEDLATTVSTKLQ